MKIRDGFVSNSSSSSFILTSVLIEEEEHRILMKERLKKIKKIQDNYSKLKRIKNEN